MEGEPLQKFYLQLVLLPKVLQYAQYVLLALGSLLLLVPVVYQIRSQVSAGRSMAGRPFLLPPGPWTLHLGQRPGSVPGTGSCRWVLASPVGPATSPPVLGGLGPRPWRGCGGLWGWEAWGRMACSSRWRLLGARLSGAGRGAVNRQTLSLLPGPGLAFPPGDGGRPGTSTRSSHG